MPSPFPGMDPYLERFWNDVHGKLVTYIADELNAWLPPCFRATMQERVVITDLDQPVPGAQSPDVAVLDWPTGNEGAAEAGGVATVVHSQRLLVRAPALLSDQGEPLKQHRVEIVDSKFGEKVVTVIEVLIPVNKRPGDGRLQFRRKQEYRNARISRVEIDLLREGKRMFEFPERFLSPEQHKPYYVTVHRGGRPGEAELYALDLRDPLPAIRVPLRAGDPDVPLALQPLMNRVYQNGRFPIDYDDPCDPPLDGADAEWARQILAKLPAGR